MLCRHTCFLPSGLFSLGTQTICVWNVTGVLAQGWADWEAQCRRQSVPRVYYAHGRHLGSESPHTKNRTRCTDETMHVHAYGSTACVRCHVKCWGVHRITAWVKLPTVHWSDGYLQPIDATIALLTPETEQRDKRRKSVRMAVHSEIPEKHIGGAAASTVGA